MEHIVQFAIGIDDNRIIEELERSAVKSIENDIKQTMIDRMFEKNWGSVHANPREDALSYWVKELVKNAILQHKDEIVEKAAKEVASSMKRSKAVKDAAERAVRDANASEV